jgi:hypothetical protein
MKTLEYIEEHELTVITETLTDQDGDVISEDITCQTSTRLPKLVLMDFAEDAA